jgi:hypothetical protein
MDTIEVMPAKDKSKVLKRHATNLTMGWLQEPSISHRVAHSTLAVRTLLSFAREHGHFLLTQSISDHYSLL